MGSNIFFGKFGSDQGRRYWKPGKYCRFCAKTEVVRVVQFGTETELKERW